MCGVVLASFGDEPPTEFRLFKAGPNRINGKEFLFDEAAAAALMAAYTDRGTDVMIDLEHQALADDAILRADAKDARGWAKLELRGGELWASQVKWGPDGERRIREKTQRYVSPAFLADDSGRIVELINIAMVAMPGTHSAPALVAATKEEPKVPVAAKPKAAADSVAAPKANGYIREGTNRKLLHRASMNPESVQKALDALEAGDLEALKAILKELIASAAAGVQAPPAEASASTDPTTPNAESKETAELAAFGREACAGLGRKSVGEARIELRAVLAKHAELTSQAVALEASERLALVADLVKCGAEFPGTAFEGDPEKKVLCKRLADEPIDGLRKRVELHRAALGGNPPAPAKPPPAGAGEGGRVVKTSKGDIELSAREISNCESQGVKVEAYAENKAIREAARRK